MSRDGSEALDHPETHAEPQLLPDIAQFSPVPSALYACAIYMVCMGAIMCLRIIVFPHDFHTVGSYVSIICIDALCVLVGVLVFCLVGRAADLRPLMPVRISSATTFFLLLVSLVIMVYQDPEQRIFPYGEVSCSLSLLVFFLEDGRGWLPIRTKRHGWAIAVFVLLVCCGIMYRYPYPTVSLSVPPVMFTVVMSVKSVWRKNARSEAGLDQQANKMKRYG
ncbi:hypothetical protein KIPB_009187 [Kipferlia bialata]|uniref:Uncharacterized protein n=1 Tax=Kipferlia bialata TaxID=797122 RepID=A0A9K3GLE0_9EUKA|nr:hypothetical protein KIPB_009187 [Kipferlia bialata]|eukprot:g9187.t1